jgi:hypothetical protein
MGSADRSQTATVVGKAYDLVLWLLPKVEKFPRSYRFSVGDRMVTVGLDLLLLLVEAAYSAEKTELLEGAKVAKRTKGFLQAGLCAFVPRLRDEAVDFFTARRGRNQKCSTKARYNVRIEPQRGELPYPRPNGLGQEVSPIFGSQALKGRDKDHPSSLDRRSARGPRCYVALSGLAGRRDGGYRTQAVGLGFARPPRWGWRHAPRCPAKNVGHAQPPGRGLSLQVLRPAENTADENRRIRQRNPKIVVHLLSLRARRTNRSLQSSVKRFLPALRVDRPAHFRVRSLG